MKRIFCIIICLVLLLSIAACTPDNVEVASGIYYLDGNFEAGKTPYILLYDDSKEFFLKSGTSLSYSERGTYEIKGDQLIATTEYNTYTFDINKSTSLVLMDSGSNDYFNFQLGMEFIFGEVKK